MTAVRREVQRLVEKEGSPTDPAVRGPVPLHRYYEAGNAMHVALPHLTTGSAAAYLVEFVDEGKKSLANATQRRGEPCASAARQCGLDVERHGGLKIR